jgi:hypothetical protein
VTKSTTFFMSAIAPVTLLNEGRQFLGVGSGYPDTANLTQTAQVFPVQAAYNPVTCLKEMVVMGGLQMTPSFRRCGAPAE